MRSTRVLAVAAALIVVLSLMGGAGATPPEGASAPFDYWTAERISSAQPRDFVMDARGLAYIRGADGALAPHGHSVAAERQPLTVRAASQPLPLAKPGEGDPADTTPPLIQSLDPDGTTIGQTYTFTATVTDESGVKSVTFTIAGTRFTPSCDPGSGVCSLAVTFNGEGEATWTVSAKDNAPRGGNSDSLSASFTVSAGAGGGGGGAGDVANSRWIEGGAVQMAAGRILFSMPGGDYVCSGTAIVDETSGRSVILTAAHCVYDDVAKEFASNAIFIPSQDDGGADGTDWNCANDPVGCWSVDHGVVDINWTERTFPDNIPWDYGYYVVSDDGAHEGLGSGGALDTVVPALDAQFTAPGVGASATALGYSYDDDPWFMYCQESLGTNGATNYWLASCGLSGGSSGGPWIQPIDGGNGPVFSVNSWGYTSSPGMAGPKLHGTSAPQVFEFALGTDLASSVRGYVYDPTGGSESSLVASSEGSKGTWTAIVTDSSGSALTGSWSEGSGTCDGAICSLQGIAKRTASVTFFAESGEAVEVFKP